MKNKLTLWVLNNPDKILHFIVGYTLTQILFLIPIINILAIIPLVYGIAFINESIDEFKYDNFSWLDILYTLIGSIISYIYTLCFMLKSNIPIILGFTK